LGLVSDLDCADALPSDTGAGAETRGQVIARSRTSLERPLADGTRYADLEVERLARDLVDAAAYDERVRSAAPTQLQKRLDRTQRHPLAHAVRRGALMARRGRPAADRAQVRAELSRTVLLAAEHDIVTGRFAELSIEQLTSQAGISRSKFYVYFQDKDDLIRAWFTAVWTEISVAQRTWWALDETASQTDLRAALARIVEAYSPHRTLMAAVYDQALHSRVIREEVDRVIKDNTTRLAKHIRDGQRDGYIDPELLPPETAAWLTWMAERTQHALGPSDDLERHIDTYTDIVWHTLYAKAD
jgi:AcrR family transcriptional regulator